RHALQLLADARCPELCAELAEQRQRLLERLAREPLLLEAPQDLSVHEERACALEDDRATFVLDERPLRGAAGLFELAARRKHERTAARTHCEAPRDPRPRPRAFEARHDRLRPFELAGGDRSLGRVAVDAEDRRL